MKKQKRYDNREQIITAIDAAKLKLIALTREAEDLDAEARKLFKTQIPINIENGRSLRAQSDKKKRSAFLLEEKRIPRLGRTLADFDTETMPVDGLSEKAVVLSD